MSNCPDLFGRDQLIFGNKSTFAISCDDVTRGLSRGTHVGYGSFVYFAGGELIGDPAYRGVPLNFVVHWLDCFLKGYGHRESPYFRMMEVNKLFKIIVTGAFDPEVFDSLCESESVDWSSLRSRYHLGQSLFTSLDGFEIILVETGLGHDRIIWKQHQGVLSEIHVTHGYFRTIANGMITWLREEFEIPGELRA